MSPSPSNGHMTLAYALEIAHAERDRLRALLHRVYHEAYNPSAHEKPLVQALWQAVGAEVGAFIAKKPSRFG